MVRSDTSCPKYACGRDALKWPLDSFVCIHCWILPYKDFQLSAFGSESIRQPSQYVYWFSAEHPNDVRSCRAAVRIIRFCFCMLGPTKTPEKQAEISTTVGLSPQARSRIRSNICGVMGEAFLR